MNRFAPLLPAPLLLGLMLLLVGCSSITGSSGYGTRADYAVEQDTETARTLWDRIRDSEAFDNTHINVDVYNGLTLLTGQVPDERLKQRAGELAANTEGVRHLRNELTVGPNTSTQRRLRDTWITARIRTRLTAGGRFDPDRVRIMTENATVYLMGLVRPAEAEYLVNLVSDTSGVEGIVRVFQYIDQA